MGIGKGTVAARTCSAGGQPRARGRLPRRTFARQARPGLLEIVDAAL